MVVRFQSTESSYSSLLKNASRIQYGSLYDSTWGPSNKPILEMYPIPSPKSISTICCLKWSSTETKNYCLMKAASILLFIFSKDSRSYAFKERLCVHFKLMPYLFNFCVAKAGGSNSAIFTNLIKYCVY